LGSLALPNGLFSARFAIQIRSAGETVMSFLRDPVVQEEAPEAKSTWAFLRKSNPANIVLPRTRKWLDSLPPDVRPTALAEQFPRIVNLIAMDWSNLRAAQKLLDGYVIDQRGGRKGFPPQIAKELKALRHYAYTRLR